MNRLSKFLVADEARTLALDAPSPSGAEPAPAVRFTRVLVGDTLPGGDGNAVHIAGGQFRWREGKSAKEEQKEEEGSGSSELLLLALSLERRVPLPFDMEVVQQTFPVTYANSMNTVLLQELGRLVERLADGRHGPSDGLDLSRRQALRRFDDVLELLGDFRPTPLQHLRGLLVEANLANREAQFG